MRIIREGKLPNTTKIKTCPNCQTVFEFDKSEQTFVTDSSPFDGNYQVPGVVCPFCHKAFRVGYD